MQLKKIGFLTGFILLILSLNAQYFEGFGDNPNEFLPVFSKYFKKARNLDKNEEELAKIIVEQYELFWNTDALSIEQKKQTLAIANQMNKNKMRPFPELYNFFDAIYLFANKELSEENFSVWFTCLDHTIKNAHRKYFLEFLEMSKNLLKDNTLYASTSTKWKSSNNNFNFGFTGEEPVISFNDIDLKCYSKGDSSVIYQTSGKYYPTRRKPYWEGVGGTIYWEKAGYARDSVYATLKNYNIKISTSKYEADSVLFVNKKYFNSALLGSLFEKVIANRDLDRKDKHYAEKVRERQQKATYPRFESYNKRLEIKQLFEKVDYLGGFAMYGRKFIGIGTPEDKAKITVYYKDVPFLVSKSLQFIIRPTRITSQQASVNMVYEGDSIFHPGLTFKFFNDKRELSLIRIGEGLQQTPFFNSYHKIEMNVEAIYWNIDEPLMNFKSIGITGMESEAYFVSENYYSEAFWNKIQGIDETHPLTIVKKVSYANDTTREITLDQVVQMYGRFSKRDIKIIMLKLALGGFVSYDLDNDKIYIKDKVFNFINSKIGSTDYDVITFLSKVVNKNNAELSLENFDLELYGVRFIVLSDSQNVFIQPRLKTKNGIENRITLKKNRDFTFEGEVNAGRFDYYGQGFTFEYDKFRINMDNVDSLGIRVEKFEKDIKPNDRNFMTRCKTTIQKVTGDLNIDHPNNKSGLHKEDFPQYPIFNSKEESFAYYNKIKGGIYPKEKFYFLLEPFTIDSLANFTNEQLRFDGTLISAGIFPDIKETLRLQPDYSLGFVHETPPSGYEVFGGKGKFVSTITLNNSGLKGDGDINYLTSTTKSNDFTFYPDSLHAIANDFHIRQQSTPVEYPDVKSKGSVVRWLPYKDVMHVQSVKTNPFDFYEGESKLSGGIALRPEGLTGYGKMELLDSYLTSDLYKFKRKEFDADTADFRLFTRKTKELALITTNYKAHIDFNQRIGKFKSNGGYSSVTFPFNQYMCYMDRFDWFMDNEEIEMKSDKKTTVQEGGGNVSYDGSKFVSIHPKQDSLEFVAPNATYSLKDYIIHAENVNNIKVADAKIYPDKGNVDILKDAVMKTLENASVLANDVTKYHNIVNANINVYGKYNYAGVGDYEYIDELNRKQIIHFDTIKVDSTTQTFARGSIADEADFTLSPNYSYKGSFSLKAAKEFLNFDGYCQLHYNCDTITKHWISFNSDINPKDIYIPIDTVPTDEYKKKLTAGIVLSNKDSLHIYPSPFYMQKKSNDINLISSFGFLYFDKAKREYQIASMERLKQPLVKGDFVSLNTRNCKMFGQGKVTTGIDLDLVTFDTYGNAAYDLKKEITNLEVVALLNFHFDDNALEIMAKEFNDYPVSRPVNLESNIFQKMLYEIFEQKDADKIISEISLTSNFKKIPKELQKTLVITDLKMEWNSQTRSYRGDGFAGIVSSGKTQIGKSFKVKIELKKKRSFDEMSILIEIDSYNWYYFNYQRGILKVVSSNDEFNNVVRAVDEKKRKIKSDDGKSYQFLPTQKREKEKFVQKYEAFEE